MWNPSKIMNILASSISILIVVLCVCRADLVEDLENQIASDRADIYLKFRDIVFPRSPYFTSKTTHNRFILMYPGKVLNYYDYYPGDEYTASLKTANYETARYNLVPPSIMEKWFDISDVVPSGFLDGGITSGKQLSTIYETIISQMTVKNFKNNYVDADAKYNEASKYLTEPVQNPVNQTENTTRMFLYSFYQEEYTQTRLMMEEKINTARKIYSSLEYQLWFQRNYNLLNLKVDSAYTKWHVFGDKQLVETYKTYLETTSTNTQLEDARVLLRSSGVTSLDRTRTVYPVSFEPSNWYEYLLPQKVPPSRDMLITKRSLFQSQRDVFNTILKHDTSVGNTGTNKAIDALINKVNFTTDKRKNASAQALKVHTDCLYKNAKEDMQRKTPATKDPCNELRSAVANVVNATFLQAQAKSDFLTVSFLLKSEDYRSYLQSKIRFIDREIEKINDKLKDSQSVYLREILGSPDISSTNQLETEPSRDWGNNWMQFEYYRNTSMRNTHNKLTTVKFSLTSSFKHRSLAVRQNAQLGYHQRFVNDLLKCRDIKISAELLRVTIKRQWLRPSLFENPSLFFVQVDDDTGESTYVSPPPSSEEDLRKYINGVGSDHYLLPEYVTSFLLARRLKIEFSGLEAHTTSTAISFFAQYDAHASADTNNFLKGFKSLEAIEALEGLKVFGFDLSLRVTVGEEHVTATRTATGLILSIPGVQLIGYYTQVMPEFPRGQT